MAVVIFDETKEIDVKYRKKFKVDGWVSRTLNFGPKSPILGPVRAISFLSRLWNTGPGPYPLESV